MKYHDDLDFSLPYLLERQKKVPKNDIFHVFDHIWRGGMPQVVNADTEQRQEYYNSYIDTYLMRDVAELGGITDSLLFRRFLTACAALAAKQLNYKTLADSAEISQPTAKEWVRLLESMGIIFLLQPYYNNELNRLTNARLKSFQSSIKHPLKEDTEALFACAKRLSQSTIEITSFPVILYNGQLFLYDTNWTLPNSRAAI